MNRLVRRHLIKRLSLSFRGCGTSDGMRMSPGTLNGDRYGITADGMRLASNIGVCREVAARCYGRGTRRMRSCTCRATMVMRYLGVIVGMRSARCRRQCTRTMRMSGDLSNGQRMGSTTT